MHVDYIKLVEEVDSISNWRAKGFRSFVREYFPGYTCREIAGYWVQYSNELFAGWLWMPYSGVTAGKICRMISYVENDEWCELFDRPYFAVIHSPKKLPIDPIIRLSI